MGSCNSACGESSFPSSALQVFNFGAAIRNICRNGFGTQGFSESTTMQRSRDKKIVLDA